MSIDKIVHGRVEPGLSQGRNHEVTFPGAVMRGVPMLERATAADAEMGTNRLDALRAFDLDSDGVAAIRVT